MKRVAAVFATMNRANTAITCLERLAAQSQKPWRIVIADNASTDDTVKRVRTWDSKGLSVDVVEVDENIGNAGGERVAIEAAFDAGADGVWILDDDSWPQPEALEQLLDPDGPTDGVRTSMVVDPETGDPSWPFQVPDGKGWRLVEHFEDDLDWVRIRRSWLGALITRSTRERVGPVNSDLFLRGEDEDYPRRIEKAGIPVHVAKRSILHHPPAGPLKSVRFLGQQVVLEYALPPEKLYYRMRNSWWLAKQDQGVIRAVALALVHLFILVRYSRPLRPLLTTWWQAFLDGFQNRLGRMDAKR